MIAFSNENSLRGVVIIKNHKTFFRVMCPIILILTIVVSIVFIFASKNNSENPFSLHKPVAVNVLASDLDEVKGNSVWCGSFQLAWNEFSELFDTKIEFIGDSSLTENLNSSQFSKNNIKEETYIVKSGYSTYSLKSDIEKEISAKFNTKSNILDSMNWYKKTTQHYTAYAMLCQKLNFETPFYDLGKGDFKGKTIKYFGFDEKNEGSFEMRSQVFILYYENENDFAIGIHTKENEVIYICKNPQGKTFDQMFKNMKNKQVKDGDWLIKNNETLKIPYISIDETKQFDYLTGKTYKTTDKKEITIDTAIQDIKFELDEQGADIKSEAAIQGYTSAAMPTKPRQFILDDTFALFIVNDKTPYFAVYYTNF